MRSAVVIRFVIFAKGSFDSGSSRRGKRMCPDPFIESGGDLIWFFGIFVAAAKKISNVLHHICII